MSKITHKLTLSYITWGLIWDAKKRRKRNIKNFKKEEEKYQCLEKLKFRGNTGVSNFQKREKERTTDETKEEMLPC